jgi:hypothetical protein
MTALAEVAQSKGHGEENFPVASKLISPRHRATILAFYRFARAADDVADDPALSESEKRRGLDALEATLLAKSDGAPDALPLRAALAEKNLGPRHPLDLLTAFRRDVTKPRYESWDDLIDYCRFSAMPVGRFVLDVHGESEALWPGNDALCAALQIINHLQDCAKDYRDLDRVVARAAALPFRIGAQEHGAIGNKRRILERHRGFPSRSRGRGDPARRRKPQSTADAAGPVARPGAFWQEAACVDRLGCGGGGRDGPNSARRHSSGGTRQIWLVRRRRRARARSAPL